MINDFSMVEPFTATLLAGERLPIGVRGSVIAVSSAKADFYIEIAGQRALVRQGFVLRSPRGAFFNGIQIVNGATAQTLTVMIGEGDIDLPIPNLVEVEDVAKTVSLEERSFFASLSMGPTVSNYNHHQVYNASTTDRYIIDRFHLESAGAAVSFEMHFYNTALTTVANEGKAKAGGAAEFNLQLRSQVSTGLLTGGAASSGTFLVPLFDVTTIDMTDPIVIAPGEGLLFICTVVNQSSITMFQAKKEPV